MGMQATYPSHVEEQTLQRSELSVRKPQEASVPVRHSSSSPLVGLERIRGKEYQRRASVDNPGSLRKDSGSGSAVSDRLVNAPEFARRECLG